MPTSRRHTLPRVFIASPLFNKPQHDILDRLENTIDRAGYGYYSARIHSGSDKMTPEQRKDIREWDPVFASNEAGLNECRVCIAVLEYALPEDRSSYQQLALLERPKHAGEHDETNWIRPLELPDAGTVWETGYMRAQGKLVIGFHTTKRAKHLNLMLSHGCDALISGWQNLEAFLSRRTDTDDTVPDVVQARAHFTRATEFTHSSRMNLQHLLADASLFNWSACETWGNEVE